jgi:hypothetical protein
MSTFAAEKQLTVATLSESLKRSKRELASSAAMSPSARPNAEVEPADVLLVPPRLPHTQPRGVLRDHDARYRAMLGLEQK